MTIVPTSETSHGGTDPIRCSIEALFEALETPLLGYAFRLVQSGDLAQDLVQEAFLRLHHHWESVREPKPWLFQTVHHLAVSHIRKSSRLSQLDATKEGVDASLDPSGNPYQLPDEWIAHQEALGLVRLTLDGMDEQSRQLIRLKFEEEKSYKEISAIMGLTPGHVGYLLHHAMKSMAQELKQAGLQ